MKNYYHILGVSSDAPRHDIKMAFRELVRALHPDRVGGSSTDEFLDAQEAYAVLSDPSRRRAYDRRLITARSRPARYADVEPLIPEPSATEPPGHASARSHLNNISLSRSFRTYSPSFDEIFDHLWRNFSSLDSPKAEGVRSLSVEITMTSDEARRGGHARLMVPAQAICPTCRGRGIVSVYECWRCAGEGAISGDFPVTLPYPAGIPDGYTIELSLEHLGIRNSYLTVIFRVVGRSGG